MKKLTLVRHGKSSWEYQVGDLDRPLKERGIRDAERIAMRFSELSELPEAAFSSPAVRALHTGQIVCRSWGWVPELLEVREEIYDFTGERVLAFVRGLDNLIGHAAVFGHNEALTNLVNALGDRPVDNLPTCGLASLEFAVDKWSEVEKGVTRCLLFPRDLKHT